MSVSLLVKERSEIDAVECWMCTKLTTIFKTTIEFENEGQETGGICLCVEHLDAIVSAALARHQAELACNNTRWYEKADDDYSEEEYDWLKNEGWKS